MIDHRQLANASPAFQRNYSTQSHDRNRAITFLRAVIHSVTSLIGTRQCPRTLSANMQEIYKGDQSSTFDQLFSSQPIALSASLTRAAHNIYTNSTNNPDLPSKLHIPTFPPPSLLSRLSIPHPHCFRLQHQPQTSTRGPNIHKSQLERTTYPFFRRQ